MAEQDAQSCNNSEPQTEMLRPIMTNSTTPPCGVCVQPQTSSQHRTSTLTHFTLQHLSKPIPAQIKQLALAKRQWQRLRCRPSQCMLGAQMERTEGHADREKNGGGKEYEN